MSEFSGWDTQSLSRREKIMTRWRSGALIAAFLGVSATVFDDDPEVFLDHVYVTVDSLTYVAMMDSPFLNDTFAMFGVRTNSSGERTWSAIGVGGERTYIEIFPEGDQYGPAGRSGIAFSVAETGALERLAARIRSQHGREVQITHRSGTMRGAELPWYKSLYVVPAPVGSESRVSRWLMEYEQPFIETLLGDSPRPSGRELRKGLRARRYDPTRPFRDILGVSVSVSEPTIAQFREELLAYGFSIASTLDGFVAKGTDLTITVRAGEEEGISSLRLKVGEQIEISSGHRFGSTSSLWMENDSTVVWTF